MARPAWRTLAIVAAALAGALFIVITLAPASLLASRAASASDGRLALEDAAGTIWNGQADIVLHDGAPPGAAHAARDGGPEQPATGTRLPGRLTWRLSAWRLLIGAVDLTLSDPALLDAPLALRADAGGNATFAADRLRVPAAALQALGAPWNTIQPGGALLLEWDTLHLRAGALHGAWRIEWIDASSSLSPIVPFGHYRLQADGIFDGATLQLETLTGPMEMRGNGTIANGRHLRFQGTAGVQAGTDPAIATQLSGLISLLGRRDGDGAILDFGT